MVSSRVMCHEDHQRLLRHGVQEEIIVGKKYGEIVEYDKGE